MNTESVSCNNCGAPLQVAPTTNFVTCGHCGSRLTVKRTGSSLYTELLGQIDRTTQGMTHQLAEIAYRAELERIDREWEQERQRFLTTDKRGNVHEPSAAGGFIGGAIAAGFGLFWTVMAFWITGQQRAHFGGLDDGPPAILGCFPFFGLIFVGFGLWAMFRSPTLAREYEQARQAYLRRRAAVTVDQFRPKPGPSGSYPG